MQIKCKQQLLRKTIMQLTSPASLPCSSLRPGESIIVIVVFLSKPTPVTILHLSNSTKLTISSNRMHRMLLPHHPIHLALKPETSHVLDQNWSVLSQTLTDECKFQTQSFHKEMGKRQCQCSNLFWALQPLPWVVSSSTW